jgi:exosome complex exonuclease RRP6
MQVSTRSRDFVIDVIKLRSFVGPTLARAFADPTTLKVLHGADYDILWLQKDFGLYVVNMFDTGQAARLLNMACGLGSLLDVFCSVKV